VLKTVVFLTVELITVVVDEVTGVSLAVLRGFFDNVIFRAKNHVSGSKNARSVGKRLILGHSK